MSSDTALSIAALADGSDIAGYSWNDRGVAPKGYIRGMAVMFGRVYCKMNANRDAASEMATADSGDDSVDALTWYAPSSANSAWTIRHRGWMCCGISSCC